MLASSCARQKHSDIQKIKHDTHLFISMPESSFTFEHIQSNLYTALAQQFRRMGYHLVDNPKSSDYSLETVVNDYSSTRRYVSPDILLFSYSLKLDITCSLYDGAGVLIKEKKFSMATLVSKAKNPIMNSSFLVYEGKKIFQSIAPQIELYFRSFLLHEQKKSPEGLS